MSTRDIIVIGASMGGIEALSALVRGLPVDLPAALLVVQHTSAESPGLLAEILSRDGGLPAVMAADEMAVERGRIYVAPPNRHLLLTADGIRVTFGPRENRSRPAIDPLFRTAAVNFGSRVIGVVLTGLLGDGTAGLRTIERCGGVCVVQSPETARYGDMPSRALAAVPSAYRASLDEMAALLTHLSKETAAPSPPVPDAIKLEAQLTERAMGTENWNQIPGTPTRFTCPECQGAIQETHEEGLVRFRCRVGHAYSAEDFAGEKAKTVEDVLWVALQTLEERALMLETMAEENRQRTPTTYVGTFADRAREARMQADRLRAVLADLAG